MVTKRRSWKDVIERRRKENFVGRAEYLDVFADNFATEEPAFLLFFVVGEGGVGKTTLLRQFEEVATKSPVDAIVVTCNDEHLSPAAAMGYIAERLAEHNIRSREFDERYKTYRARRDEIEADPKAPRGALNLVVKGMTGFAIKAARRTPGVGVFAEYVDEDEAGEALTHGINYIVDRVANKDEVRLLREPERILTPLFIDLLNEACEKQRVVLMFDVFERTREALEPWLLEFLTFTYGEFDIRLTFVISGRDAPDQRWTEIASSICHINLEPFTAEETRLYLSHRDIVDEQLVAQIHDDTGGLPVLVELLAGTNPEPGQPLPDISKDAVKRFLQWIPEEEKRRAALLAAVPRQFNQDVLGAALGEDEPNPFNWLAGQSYIRTSSARGWFYHEKVRALMLRYLRNAMPGKLKNAHGRLVDFFHGQQEEMALESKAAYDSETWKKLEVERVYHLLCEQPDRRTGEAVSAFLGAFRWRWGFGEALAHAFAQAGAELGSQQVQTSARLLLDLYQAYDKNDYDRFVDRAGTLLQRSDPGTVAVAALFARRGVTYRQMGQYEEALADLSRAVELDESYAWAIASRGVTYRQMGQYEEALADLSRAVELDESYAWAIASRGVTYLQMGQYEEALADLSRAVELDESYAWAIASRGETYRQMGQYEEALADFSRAVELDESDAWAIASRGETYRQMGQYEEALADFSRAVELDESYAWAIASRGLTYRQMGKYEEALADFSRAVELDESYTWAITNRGLTYRQMGQYEEALADFNRAVELDEGYDWAIASRGETYQQMGKYEEALADFSRAVELDESDAWAIAHRGETYRQMGKYEEALADFSRAVELDESYTWAITNRGLTYRQMGKYEEALADFSRAVELDESYTWAITNRGLTYRQMGQYEEALADFNRAVELDEGYDWAIASRGETYQQMGKYEEALADFSRAVELDESDAWAIAHRGLTYRQMGKYEEALADFSRAVELDESDAWAIAHRGETYRQMGQYEEALADFSRAVELDESYAWAIAHRGETYGQMGQYEEALADFNRAVELDEGYDWAIASRGETYQQMGQYEEALADFSRAIELEPEQDGFPRSRRAAAYQAMGNQAAAEVDIAHVMALPTEDASDYYDKVVVHVLVGQHDKALTLLSEAVARDPAIRNYARIDDVLNPLKDLPEFQELINGE